MAIYDCFQYFNEDLMVDLRLNILNKYNISAGHPIRKSVNYKQAIGYLNSEYGIEVAFEKALFATRQLAKRQTTWIRGWEKFKRVKIKEIKEIKQIKEDHTLIDIISGSWGPPPR